MYLSSKYQTLTKIIIVILIFCYGTLIVAPIYATNGAADKVNNYGLKETAGAAGLTPDKEQSVTQIIGYVIGALLSLMGVLFIILIIAGGIMWMTAAGSTDRLQKAAGIMKNAAIGLIIVLAAYAITTFVINQITTATGINPTEVLK